MNCQETARLLDPYLDSELDARTCAEVREHLQGCPACARRFADQEAFLRRIEAALRPGPATAGLWRQIEGRLATADREPTQPADEPMPVPARPSRSDPAAHAAREPAAGWRFWLWPSPRFYVGLATAWAVVLTTHLATVEPSASSRAAHPGIHAGSDTLLLEQRQLFAELLAPSEDPRPASTAPTSGSRSALELPDRRA